MLDHNNQGDDIMTASITAPNLRFLRVQNEGFQGDLEHLINSDISTSDLARLALIADRMTFLYRNLQTGEVSSQQGLISTSYEGARDYYRSLQVEGSLDQLREEAALVLISHHFTYSNLIF